jgi:hypothetical protein
MRVLGQHATGRQWLEDTFRLCRPLPNGTSSSLIAQPLIEWAQSPWFDLAEGSYPYRSSYISYALTHAAGVQLPAWPLQAACWTNSSLHSDMGIMIVGNQSNVQYSITYGDSDLILDINWDSVTPVLPANVTTVEELLKLLANATSVPNPIISLLTSVRDAVSVWYNATLNLICYDIDTVAPNSKMDDNMSSFDILNEITDATRLDRILSESHSNATVQCYEKMKLEGSWPSLCCNEEMNLIITAASGLGNDVFWPPTHPRGVTTYAQLVNVTADVEPCTDPDGMYGYPQQTRDPWSHYQHGIEYCFFQRETGSVECRWCI